MEGIYPTNHPVRAYQWAIVHTALAQNTLVSLPTGLGKTLIAAVVMCNFHRWFPTAKLLFLAPTRPLVAQQLRACCETAGFSPASVDVLLDKRVANRPQIWENGSVFFSTPQVVLNDLQSGALDPHSIRLIVFDEAHKGSGEGYAYAKIVAFLNALNLQSAFRVLALSATPGTDIESIQAVISNLNIQTTQLRLDSSPDVKPYVNSKQVVAVACEQLPSFDSITQPLFAAVKPTLDACFAQGIYPSPDPNRISHYVAMQKGKEVLRSQSSMRFLQNSRLQLLAVVGRLLQRLRIYGLIAFADMFAEKRLEFKTKWDAKKTTSKILHSFWFHKRIVELDVYLKQTLETNAGSPLGLWCHSKFHFMVLELKRFFSQNPQSKCILFVDLRDVALTIVREIESAASYLNPHIFIGQSGERTRFDETDYLKKNLSKKKQKELNLLSQEESKATSVVPDNSRIESSVLAHKNGLKQSSQSQVLAEFKSGTYNILVATSIGEEGLDIGEVDLIINFDSKSSVIKNLQRMGRTGRKRQGRVVSLFSGNEEDKFNEANHKYQWIQNQLETGAGLEYFTADYPLLKGEPVLLKQKVEVVENEVDEEKLMDRAIKETKARAKRAKGKPTKKRPQVDWVGAKGGFGSAAAVETGQRPAKRHKAIDALLAPNVPEVQKVSSLTGRPAKRGPPQVAPQVVAPQPAAQLNLDSFNDEDDELLCGLFGREARANPVVDLADDSFSDEMSATTAATAVTTTASAFSDDAFSDDSANEDLVQTLSAGGR